MIFLLIWFIATGVSELLLWQYSYLYIVSPILFIALGLTYWNESERIEKSPGIPEHERKIQKLRVRTIFLISLVVMLSVAALIKILF